MRIVVTVGVGGCWWIRRIVGDNWIRSAISFWRRRSGMLALLKSGSLALSIETRRED